MYTFFFTIYVYHYNILLYIYTLKSRLSGNKKKVDIYSRALNIGNHAI